MKAKKKVSLTLIVVLIVTSFLLVLDTVAGIFLVSYSTNSTKDVLNRKMLELAQTAATLVDGDDIASLKKGDEKDPNCEAYTTNLEILAGFKTSADENEADLAYIYCLVKTMKDGKETVVFSIDPNPDEDIDDYFMVREPNQVTEGMLGAFAGKPSVDKQPYRDDWGVTYSAYAPIFLSDKTTVAGIIGVDVWAGWFDKQVRENAIAITIIASLSIASGVLIALIITFFLRRRLNNLSEEVISLEKDVQVLLNEIHATKPNNENVPQEEVKGTADMEVIRDQIHTAQEEIRQYIEYSRQRAYIDSLTKLNNRLSYFDKVKDINVKITNEEELSFDVIVYDLNGLKDINDSYGHEYGDIALVKSANIVKDVYGKENVYRIGGDEFVVILINASKEDINLKAKSFDSELASVNQMSSDMPVKISLSCGVGFFNKEKDKEFLDVFRKADKDMYKNKDNYYHKKRVRRNPETK